MRIAYLSNACLPSRTANSVHVMKMCRAFAGGGHSVRLFAPDRRECREDGVEDLFGFYGVEPVFEVSMPFLPKVPGRSFIYAAKAAFAARAWRPDLVYGRELIAVFVAAMLGLPVLFESHSPVEHEVPVVRWMFSRLIRLRSFKGLNVITWALKEHYEHCFPVLRGHVYVAPDGADPVPDHSECIALQGRPGVLQVGYVGHLYRGKGMEVIAELAPRCPWADFHVVGGTEKDLRFWRMHTKGIENIVFHGYVSHALVRGYVQAFDVVLLPNQAEVATAGSGGNSIGRWTSPLKLFEYMAAAKAIIASDLPVLREILEDGRNALLCVADDIESWRRALERLQNDSELRKTMAVHAAKDFSGKYSWSERAKNIINAYETER